MRKIIFTTVLFFIAISLLSQAPQSFTFQAVMRDGNNQLILNSPVGMRTTILQGNPNGTVVYQETYDPNPQTNSNGLITLEIGSGISEYNFATIDWANGPYFIKTEADPTGGTNYIITGTSQLMSVPYALHAKSVTWGDITGKPSKFPPSGHFHSAAEITSGTLDVARGGTGATSFPSGNVLIGRGTGAIASLPRSGIDTRVVFPPSAHSHSATDITSGTLDVARGGTGATTFTSGNVLIGSGTGAITTLPRSGIDTRTTFPPSSHTHGNITNTGAIGFSAGRIITTGEGGVLQATVGTAPGQMLYWNGGAWVNVPPGGTGQVLTMVNGVPTWLGTSAGPTDVFNPITGKIWMDRNLGASRVATSSTDDLAYGDLYQWGRLTDGHQNRTSGTTTTLSSGDTPGHGYFIKISSSPYDWRNPQNDNLWQGINGINNPCPSGYRLPTETELNAELQSWATNNAAGAFGSPLKLPMAGRRGDDSGWLVLVGSYGFYWSSTVNGAFAIYLIFYSSDAGMYHNGRAYGYSVRCIKE